MDYTRSIESAIEDVLLPRIDSIVNSILQMEEVTMRSFKLDQLRRQLKYNRLLLNMFEEISEGDEEVSDSNIKSLLLMCGVTPSSSINTASNKKSAKTPEVEGTFSLYIDGSSDPHSGSITKGTHEFKFVYTGYNITKVSASVNGFTKSAIGTTVTYGSFSTGDGTSITFILDAYSNSTDVAYTTTQTYTLT